MTRHDAINRIKTLEAQKITLRDQLHAPRVHSASIGSEGGNKSYTNLSADEIKKQIKDCNEEIADLRAKLKGTVASFRVPKIGKWVLG